VTYGAESHFSRLVESLRPLDTKSCSIGDEVFGLTYGRASAEYVAVEAGTLVYKPKELT
jgi:NADPH:quinone reductase-like Zn-dependent oxidoreductase